MSYTFMYTDLELDDIKTVTKNEIDNKWDNCDRMLTVYADCVIQMAIQIYPNNSSCDGVLEKCKVINEMYHAGVLNIHLQPIAKIIHNTPNFDKRIADGDLSLVQDLVYALKKATGKYYYCFITKYCSWHNPDKFPIFDNIVLRVLKLIDNNGYKIFERGKNVKPNEQDDNFYQNYADAIERTKPLFESFKNIDYRNIDKYFWLVGKSADKKSKLLK